MKPEPNRAKEIGMKKKKINNFTHIVAKDTLTFNITKGSDIRTDINQDLSGHSPVSSIKKFPHRFLHSLGP